MPEPIIKEYGKFLHNGWVCFVLQILHIHLVDTPSHIKQLS